MVCAAQHQSHWILTRICDLPFGTEPSGISFCKRWHRAQVLHPRPSTSKSVYNQTQQIHITMDLHRSKTFHLPWYDQSTKPIPWELQFSLQLTSLLHNPQQMPPSRFPLWLARICLCAHHHQPILGSIQRVAHQCSPTSALHSSYWYTPLLASCLLGSLMSVLPTAPGEERMHWHVFIFRLWIISDRALIPLLIHLNAHDGWTKARAGSWELDSVLPHGWQEPRSLGCQPLALQCLNQQDAAIRNWNQVMSLGTAVLDMCF